MDQNLHKDLRCILSEALEQAKDKRKISPFMELFFKQQMDYLTEHPNKVKYHPMIIKFCLGLQATSPAAYDQLRLNIDGNGVRVLPSQGTLRDYRHYITPQWGFNNGIVSELENTPIDFGFLYLGNVDLNCATLPKVDKLASYVMVFLIKSVMNPLA